MCVVNSVFGKSVRLFLRCVYDGCVVCTANNLDHILIRAFDSVRARKYSKEAVIKVKFTLEQAMKAQTGSRGIAVPIP